MRLKALIGVFIGVLACSGAAKNVDEDSTVSDEEISAGDADADA